MSNMKRKSFYTIKMGIFLGEIREMAQTDKRKNWNTKSL